MKRKGRRKLLLPLVYHSTFCQSSSHLFLDVLKLFLSSTKGEMEKRGKREIKSGKILCSFDLNRKHYRFVLPFFSSLTTMMTANIKFHKRLECFYTPFFYSSPFISAFLLYIYYYWIEYSV